MGLPNEQIGDTFVFMAAGYQYGLVYQWMEGISDPGFECQKAGIMNPGFDGGGRTWATIATLLQTAKMNHIEQLAWLTLTLERWPSSEIDALCRGTIQAERPRFAALMSVVNAVDAPSRSFRRTVISIARALRCRRN
ncbi:hypothetical protein GGD56_006864 [Rhizobium mongolense]|uniref:Uncharacterized protein n=1 Tax=Rhizobium mongolense TaxID=57676 RepID=A0ABR6IYH5_9HYPH|nr:transposase domain-containing protein [Rhizobium mongolense]MBB4232964.1 hypothetical protein [Rhizobium mongolense]